MTLQTTIESAWDVRDTLNTQTKGAVRKAVDEVIEGLDCGELRVAEKKGNAWGVNQWVKKAVLLSFRLNDTDVVLSGMRQMGLGGTNKFSYWFWDGIRKSFNRRAFAPCRDALCAVVRMLRPMWY
jgi:2,3,4,5-tetrahydropyridine-2,6-dicarboxylate N-succinyltransferase